MRPDVQSVLYIKIFNGGASINLHYLRGEDLVNKTKKLDRYSNRMLDT